MAILLSFSLVASATTTCTSPSDVRAAKLEFKRIKRGRKVLQTLARKLPNLEQKKLKRSVRGEDSHGDRIPDMNEKSRPGSTRYDADSDNN